MPMKRWQPLLCLIAWLLMPLADVSAAGRLLVFVSILPQQYFVQQIGGDHVEVQVMVPPGASPATYEPSPRQMVGLAKARLYFAIGVPFEAAWMDKIAKTRFAAGQKVRCMLSVCDLSKGRGGPE